MSSNRLFILFWFSLLMVAATSISEKKSGDLVNHLKLMLKSPSVNQSAVNAIDYAPPTILTSNSEKNRKNKLEIEKPTVIKESAQANNKSLELSEILRQGNVYSLFRYMQRQCVPCTTGPAIVGTAVIVGLGAVAAATAIGIGVGVGVGAPASIETLEPLGPITVARFFCQEIPENNLDIPDDEQRIPDSGCGKSSVRFGGRGAVSSNGTSIELENGFCAPLLKRGPCTSPFEWVTMDPNTLQARCSPRLCGRDRVYVECDGLCHDINDPNECRGGRRLFYTAFGNTTCDCPIGQYPFPNRNSDCVALFTQGPCPPGQVMTLSSQDRLVCLPSQCPPINGPDGQPLQMVPFGNGQCFALGTRGPCPASPIHLLGYDVFERSAKCVNIEDPASPYFSSPEEDALIDSLYNQIHPEYNFQVIMVQQNFLDRDDAAQRKQGVFSVSTNLPSSLLGGCRPGGSGCANPTVPRVGGSSGASQPVKSAFCGNGQKFNQATGMCRNSAF